MSDADASPEPATTPDDSSALPESEALPIERGDIGAQANHQQAMRLAAFSFLTAVVNTGVWFWAIDSRRAEDFQLILFTGLAVLQFCLGVAAIVYASRSVRAARKGVGTVVVGSLMSLGAPVGWLLGMVGIGLSGMGGAWGRPLRIRGRQLHP
ncbi:MAG: hypothetical protein KC457_18400, partial [Myxococcales bacterium]|nr:hypothetical protein [Myxococcales bacterium]